jgi:hypothetical protein
MPSQYTGVPTASQSPSPAPGTGVAPILNLPTAGDLLTISSILQAFKALADWSAWASTRFLQLRGAFAWISTTTYQAGNIAIDNLDQHVYRALSTNGNMQPSTSPSVWERFDWSSDEVAANSGVLVTATTGIAASHGATVSTANMLSLCNGAFRMITFNVTGVPGNSFSDVDLNGSTTKFSSAIYTAQVTPLFVSACAPVCGATLSVGGDPNVIRINNSEMALYIGGSLSYPSTFNFSVTAWGQ